MLFVAMRPKPDRKAAPPEEVRDQVRCSRVAVAPHTARGCSPVATLPSVELILFPPWNGGLPTIASNPPRDHLGKLNRPVEEAEVTRRICRPSLPSSKKLGWFSLEVCSEREHPIAERTPRWHPPLPAALQIADRCDGVGDQTEIIEQPVGLSVELSAMLRVRSIRDVAVADKLTERKSLVDALVNCREVAARDPQPGRPRGRVQSACRRFIEM